MILDAVFNEASHELAGDFGVFAGSSGGGVNYRQRAPTRWFHYA